MATRLELELSCILSEDNRMKPYIIVTLFHGSHDDTTLNHEKRTISIDAKGSARLQFQDVDVNSAYLRFQVFLLRRMFPGKHAGTINVLVSELVSSSAGSDRKINLQGSGVFELAVNSSRMEMKGSALQVSYKLTMPAKDDTAAVVSSCCEKPEIESNKRVPAAAIENDTGLLKALHSFRTAFALFNWTS